MTGHSPSGSSDSGLGELKRMSAAAWEEYYRESDRLEPWRRRAAEASRAMCLEALDEIREGGLVIDVADVVVGGHSITDVQVLADQLASEFRHWIYDTGRGELDAGSG